MFARKAVTAVEFILLAGMAVFIVVLMSTYTLRSVFSPTLNQSNQSLTGIEERSACFYVNCADTCTQAIAGAPWAWRNHSAVCENGQCIYRSAQNCTTGCLNGQCIETAPRVDFTWTQVPSGAPSFCNWVSFTSTSTDPDGRIIRYYWNFGNGTSFSLTTPNVDFPGSANYPAVYPGKYDVTLEVVDNSGKKNSTTRRITLCSSDVDGDFNCDLANPDGTCPV